MWLLKQASPAARAALVYITIGALIVIWTGVWITYLYNNPPQDNTPYYFCGGLMVTGITLVFIGFGLGRIGRSARHADLPPAGGVEVVNSPVAVTGAAPLAAPPRAGAAVAVPAPSAAVVPPHGVVQAASLGAAPVRKA